MPSVTMKDGMPSRTLMRPLSVPAARPVPRQSDAAVQNGQCQSIMATPSAAPQKPRTEPMDRSIPPMMRTRVMPAATTVRVGMRFASVVSVRTVRNLSLKAPNSKSSPIQIAKRAANSPRRLRGIMAGDLAHRAGDEADVIFVHSFVHPEQYAGLQDRFRLGQLYLRVIHRGQTEFLDRPMSGEKGMILEHRHAIERHCNVARAEGCAFGGEGFDEGGAVTTQFFGHQPRHIKPIDAAVFFINVVGSDARNARQFLGEQVAKFRPLGGDAFEAGQLRGDKSGLKLAHAVVGAQSGGRILGIVAVSAFVAE